MTENKPVSIFFIIALSLLSIFLLNGATGAKSDSNNDVRELGELLRNIEKPIHVVIAIDSSNSMNGSDTAKSLAGSIIGSVSERNNDNDMVGYSSWNHYPIMHNMYLSYANPDEFNNISNEINLVKFQGNTCFKAGLNDSLSLLKNYSSYNATNILVVISDGMDNCNTSIGNFTCDQIDDLNLINNYIYTIQTGDNIEKTTIMKCLERRLQNPFPFNNIIEFQERDGPNFSLNANGKIIKYKEEKSNVYITKMVEKGDKGIRIKIRLEAPSANVSDAIVMAIDSSGSFGQGGNPDYGKNLRHAIIPSMEQIDKDLPNSTISILSWDEDIDFAYSDLNNSYPKDAKFVPIKQAIKEIENNSTFVAKPFYKNIFGLELPLFKVEEPYPERFYNTSEFDPTIFDVGLSGALEVFSSQIPESSIGEKDTVLKSILFITGRSEFKNFSQSLINQSNDQNCTIYTVGIGVIQGSKMESDLRTAAEQTDGTYYYSSGGTEWTKDNIVDAISKVAEDIRNNPLLDNISLVETVYPYLNVDPSTIRVTKDNSAIGFYHVPPTVNRDGTKTIEIKIDPSENLTRDSTIEISMDAELDLSLPVEVNQSRSDVCWDIDQDTRISSISYRWIKPAQNIDVLLPENSIEF